jgi:predicted permease
LWNRLLGSVLGARREAELKAEIESHLAMQADDNVRAGMSPQQARRAAVLKFGGVESAKESYREQRGLPGLESVFADVRYALRGMRKNPGFSAVAVLTLALGLSANTTIFSLVSMLFFQPLPVKDAERLVVVLQQYPKDEFPRGLSWADYQDYRAQVQEFSDVLAIFFRPAHLSLEGRTPDRTWIEAVSGNYFAMLGIEPMSGRLFLPGEGERPGADPIVVLAHHYWRTRLGADPGIVGRSMVINGRAFTVIGIAPPSFTSAQWALAPSAFVPATMIPTMLPGQDSIFTNRNWDAFKVIAHLRPGATVGQAEAAAGAVAGRLREEYRLDRENQRLLVRPEMRTRPEPSVSGFLPFAAAVFLALAGLVLFIACANVANLMFSRALERRKEMGIRTAVGAPRRRLIRQLLTESVLLAVLAGGVGVVLAMAAGPLLAQFSPQGDIPVRPDERWQWLPLFYTVAAALLAGVVSGLAPAMRATKIDVQSVLKGAGTGGGRARHFFRSGLVMSQVAVCVVVLVCGGLFVRSLRTLAVHDLGFRPERLVMASLDLGLQGYEPDRGRRFLERLTERVQALPGVESAAIASVVPFDNQFGSRKLTPADRPASSTPGEKDDAIRAGVNRIDPGYLRTMGGALLQGRDFTVEDDAAAPRVALVNQTLASRLWPGQDPIGRSFRWVDGGDAVEVVGVVRDGKYVMLGESPRPYSYVPLAQEYDTPVTLHVRTASADPLTLVPSIRQVLQDLDRDLPVFSVRTMQEHLRSSALAFLPLRMGATLAGAQGALALLLAVMGLYGVVAYAVSQQQREIGIRVALGARARDLFRVVARGGLRPALIGLLLGVMVSFGLARLLAGLLYGLNPLDVPVFAAVVALLLGVSLLACWLPARRVMKVDPVIALRSE